MSSKICISMDNSGKLCGNEAYASPYLKYAKKYLFTPEIGYYLMDVPPGEDLKSDFRTADSPLGFVFCLGGSSRFNVEKNGAAYQYRLKQGEYSFAYLPNVTGIAEISTEKRYRAVNMFITPLLLKNLSVEYPFAKSFLSEISDTAKDSVFLRKGRITKEITDILSGLLDKKAAADPHNPSEMSKLYELVMLTFMQFSDGPQSKRKSVLQPEDIERILNAGRVIKENLASPPSVVSLAKGVGLNSFKLKYGFKEIFGTTVYGYIKEKRMEKAKDMLESGDFSVSDAAWDLGYTNVSHFIELFRRHYGITPGKFLSTKRNILTSSLISSVRRNII